MGAITRWMHPGDTVSYAAFRHLLQLKHPIEGLEGGRTEEALEEGDYPTVLFHIWNETDHEKRFTWLCEHAKFHAPLYFELALEWYWKYPYVETVALISLPLIKCGAFLASQAALHFEDHTILSVGAFIERIYLQHLEKLVLETGRMSLGTIYRSCKEDILERTAHHISNLIDFTMLADLPSPDWVAWHGMTACVSGQLPRKVLPLEGLERRLAFSKSAGYFTKAFPL